MTAKQIVFLASIIVFFFSVVAFSSFYGPSRRTFASPPKVLSADTSDQITKAWESSGVKGRVAICFTRYLNALESKESKEPLITELALDHGIVRKVFHVVPENAWPEVQKALSKRDDMRQTPECFIGIFNNGRVYISPLSKLPPIDEKALLIVEPKVWSQEELTQIGDKLKTGRLSSDLLIVIRGSDKDAETFRSATNR